MPEKMYRIMLYPFCALFDQGLYHTFDSLTMQAVITLFLFAQKKII